MTGLSCGNTRAFLVRGISGGLLVDTGYAGSLPLLRKAMKINGIKPRDIRYVMATHYHPDHAGLIGDLTGNGVKLLLIDVQKDRVHFQDGIFEREKSPFRPVREDEAEIISAEESRKFLERLGIAGEILHTPSHSGDSVSLILDGGDAFVGDLEPLEYLEAYGENNALRSDWERILAHHPKRIFYAHRPESILI